METNKQATRDQEKANLFKVIWQVANKLRGGVTGWDFKQYVLGFLFYRFISENFENHINYDSDGNKTDDYSLLKDEDVDNDDIKRTLIEEKGFFIYPSQLFKNVRKNAENNPNLNETLQKVFNAIENSAKSTESEEDFIGLFADLDFNSNKLGSTVEERNKKLISILDAFGSVDLGSFKDNTIDIFGDAYEYLMAMYAKEAGKSGGEFFTPQEVSELLAKLAIDGRNSINSVYDPACGSGSLLLKFAKLLGKENIASGFYGQEINITTFNLCRINMFLHDINFDKFKIRRGDTLLKPLHLEFKPFDAIVSNPPYSISWEGNDNPVLINDERFAPAGVLAPKSKADLAFVMHSLHHLAENGTAAIVCFPGVFYRAGAEQEIRKYLVSNNYVDTLIQLPDNLFYGTSIATTILVLKKNKKDNNVLFIDASKEFNKVSTKNVLMPEHIEKIYDAYHNRKEIQYFSKLVSLKELEENNYKLTVSTFVEQKDEREVIDIKVLNAQIKEITARQEVLRAEIDKIIAEIEREF
ncbi:type I restriction-modification system subunit M [Mycoplasmopsis columbina]|uniref:type I restriction-modification system subunit M n=1 Tax=Mycoplasmopsis columbina TaxID=114881 RepID=UPI0004A72066|nr:type I restriction-modification system subunit M [Mycoplasmopsis columbina]VEU77203.1 Probable type I restriction enzyme BthVORF4518P M protein [Mycoplasmopsis columbina]